MMKTIQHCESEVRSYSRKFPTVFATATNCCLSDENGKQYLDFFSGAGSLNYGHNNPELKRSLLEYIGNDGVTQSLDMATSAKERFLERFDEIILKPRNLEYKVQFTGPTGTNAVEAALKLARKITGRQTIVHFMNSYHGLSLGSLSVTGSVSKRNSAGVPLHYSLPMFFDGDLGPQTDTLDYFEALLENRDNGSGIPAAVILETIQGEGGVKVASRNWLRRLERITNHYGIVLIVDDIQVGCGRTGDFFSFEESDILPGLVCLSKSIGGYGLPMSLVLIRPDLDVWEPGEHTGTFRGNNLAFVTGTAALSYWKDGRFRNSILQNAKYAVSRFEEIAGRFPEAKAQVRGRGLIQGLVFQEEDFALRLARKAFSNGLLIEACGPKENVLKLLPPLTVTREQLHQGISIIEDCVQSTLVESETLSVAAG
jgi:diaminobutyrate-2-oxoglutarate transaminase